MRTVTRLALVHLQSKKARSLLIAASIFLTMVLFMTVVSISLNMLTGYSLAMRLASGTDYHGYLRTASFTLPGPALRDLLRETDGIGEAAISSNLSAYAMTPEALPSSQSFIRTVEREEDLGHFYTAITEGAFPVSDREILVSPLFFPDVQVGEEITLWYNRHDSETDRPADAVFTVSGLLHCRTEAPLQVVMAYSDTLEETYGFDDRYANVYFQFDNTINLTGKYDRLVNETLADWLQPELDKHGVLNPGYLAASFTEGLNLSTVLLICFAVTVVFLCSFLLIYNIYAIALAQDMRTFGLLAVIGTTHRQLRQMVVRQSFVLFLLTAPLGLAAGYGIGWKLLSPLLFTSLQGEALPFVFHPAIPVLTLSLTLGTLLWSATRPLKKLRTMTPVATVSYSPATDLPRRYVRRKVYARRMRTPDVLRLAGYGISRNRKKTVITALSMTLSVVLFMLVSTLCDYLLVYTESNMQRTDYVLKVDEVFRYEGESAESVQTVRADRGIGLAESTVAFLETHAYVERVLPVRSTVVEIPVTAHGREGLLVLQEGYPWFEQCPELTEGLAGSVPALVLGIPDELYGQLRMTNTVHLSADPAAENCIVYDGGRTPGIGLTTGEAYHFTWLEDSGSVRLGERTFDYRTSTSSIPVNDICNYISTSVFRPIFYLPESLFCDTFGEGILYALLLDAREDCYDSLGNVLNELGDNLSVVTDKEIQNLSQTSYTVIKEHLSYIPGVEGRYDDMNQMKNTVLSIQTVGYSMAAMIFLVGVLNMLNTSLSSAVERHREFAMLEAVGMTDRQLRWMLLLENLCGASSAVAITTLAGFPLLTLLTATAMEGLILPAYDAGAWMLAGCVAVSLLAGVLSYRLTKKAAVAERIRE